jgi:hypothetical protein
VRLKKEIAELRIDLVQTRQSQPVQSHAAENSSESATGPAVRKNQDQAAVLTVTPCELAARMKKYSPNDARQLFESVYRGHDVTWTAEFQVLAEDTSTVCDALFTDETGQAFWARFDKEHRAILKRTTKGDVLNVRGKLDIWYGTTLYLAECRL